jgi:hypothetical protein
VAAVEPGGHPGLFQVQGHPLAGVAEVVTVVHLVVVAYRTGLV